MVESKEKPLQHLGRGGGSPVSVAPETLAEGEPQPQPQFALDLGVYGSDVRGDESASYYASLPESEEATFEVQHAMTKPPAAQGECEVPQDGFHVKQVDYVRPFKVVGEVQRPGELRVAGEAKYTADAERSGAHARALRTRCAAAVQDIDMHVGCCTWKITQPYERSGSDDVVTPITEHGHLETKQQVKIDKVVYGEKQIIEGQVIPGQPGATTWDWDTQDFKPTGPMVGKCGTVNCKFVDEQPKEYIDAKSCDNLVIENVGLEVKELQEAEHHDFKQYKLHVDDSIPRLCQDTLPKGLLKAMAAKNIGVESLFKADVNFNVVKTEDVTACEVQTIAKQDFELKYDEKHTLKWKQPITKECTKDWSQDGIEYGKGTYEQTDQADITGYYIQPGAELGQINTYIRQHNDKRVVGKEKTTELPEKEEKPVGDKAYAVEKTDDWHREGEIRPQKITFHKAYNPKGETMYTPKGVIELGVKFKSVFQKCPLLKVSQNNVCKLTDAQKAAFKGHLASNEIQCIDKAVDALVAGKCVIGPDGKFVPAEHENAVNYESEAEPDPTDTSAEGILATLKERFEQAVVGMLERSQRGQEVERAIGRVQSEAAKVAEQVAAEQAREQPNAYKVSQLLDKQTAFAGRLAKLEVERDDVQQLAQKSTEDAKLIRQLVTSRAAELGMTFEEAEQVLARLAEEVRAKYDAVQQASARDEVEAEAMALDKGSKIDDTCACSDDDPVAPRDYDALDTTPGGDIDPTAGSDPTAGGDLDPTAGGDLDPTAGRGAGGDIDPTAAATSTPRPAATSTPRPAPAATSTPRPAATSTPRPAATSTPRPAAIATSTPRPAATSTPRPAPAATSTPRPAATSTPRPAATSTPRPAATSTPRPAATSTPRPAATSTPRPAATSTPRPAPAATSISAHGRQRYRPTAGSGIDPTAGAGGDIDPTAGGDIDPTAGGDIDPTAGAGGDIDPTAGGDLDLTPGGDLTTDSYSAPLAIAQTSTSTDGLGTGYNGIVDSGNASSTQAQLQLQDIAAHVDIGIDNETTEDETPAVQSIPDPDPTGKPFIPKGFFMLRDSGYRDQHVKFNQVGEKDGHALVSIHPGDKQSLAFVKDSSGSVRAQLWYATVKSKM
eukprot:tig00020961_g16644.t1